MDIHTERLAMLGPSNRFFDHTLLGSLQLERLRIRGTADENAAQENENLFVNYPQAETNTTVTTPQQTFHSFAILPYDLRVTIWALLIPGDRIVPIRYHKETHNYTPRMLPPAILQINRESREYGRKKYKEITLGSQVVRGTYMDLSRDELYLRDDVDWKNPRDAVEESFPDFRTSKLQQRAERIWRDLTRSCGMPNFARRMSMCAETYKMLMWFFITRRRELASDLGMVEEWKVVGETGMGRFEGEWLGSGMCGWTEKERSAVMDLGRTVDMLKFMDEVHGRKAALEFKVTHWCWLRRN